MNAKELADDLENSNGLQYITKVGLVSLSAQMLRQQADRIAELEKENKALHELVKQRIERNVELQTLLGKYMPQTNAEPVAWMNFFDRNVISHSSDLVAYSPNDWFPLYTTPQTKSRLNDSEIETIGKEYGIDSIYRFAYYEFARAIEERILGK